VPGSTVVACSDSGGYVVDEEYGAPGDLVPGADVAGFLEVAEAVHAHGLG
jgi:hypothetical protein